MPVSVFTGGCGSSGPIASITGVITGHPIATYTDENGVVVVISETVTTLGITGMNLIYVDENGVTNTIPLPPDVVTTLTGVAATGNAIGTYVNEGGASVTIMETITSLTLAGDVLSFTNETGVATTLTLPPDTVTTLTNAQATGNTIGTYTNEAGTAVDIKETITSVSQSAPGVLEFVDEAGVTTTLTIPAPTLTRTGPLEITFVGPDGTPVVIDLCPDVAACETTTGLTYSGTVLTYTNEDGVASTIDLANLTIDVNVGTVTYNAATGEIVLTETDGTVHTIDIGPFVETITTVTGTVAGHAIGTYTNEAGTPVVINETVTTMTLVGNTLTYTDEAGTPVVVTLPADVVTTLTGVQATGKTIGTYTNESGAAVAIKETITALTITGNTLTYTDETGTPVTITLPPGATSGAGSTVTATGVVNVDVDGTTVKINGADQLSVDPCEVLKAGTTGAATALVAGDKFMGVDAAGDCQVRSLDSLCVTINTDPTIIGSGTVADPMRTSLDLLASNTNGALPTCEGPVLTTQPLREAITVIDGDLIRTYIPVEHTSLSAGISQASPGGVLTNSGVVVSNIVSLTVNNPSSCRPMTGMLNNGNGTEYGTTGNTVVRNVEARYNGGAWFSTTSDYVSNPAGVYFGQMWRINDDDPTTIPAGGSLQIEQRTTINGTNTNWGEVWVIVDDINVHLTTV